MGTHRVRFQSPLSLPLALSGGACVCVFLGAAVTNYHKLVVSNNRSVFSHSDGGRKSETRYHHGPVPPRVLIASSGFRCFVAFLGCVASL